MAGFDILVCKYFTAILQHTGIVFFCPRANLPGFFVSVIFWREPRAKSGQKKRLCGQKAGKKRKKKALQLDLQFFRLS
jgi:hypothetical protein